MFVLCDATNGYIYRMQIYTGKNMESNLDVGLCSRVVLELMDVLEGHEVYTNNYYTSPRLYMALYEDQNNACGTARTNRTGFPKSIIRRTREDRGTIVTYQMVHSLQQHGMIEDLSIFYQPFMKGHHMERQSDVLILMGHQVMFLVRHCCLIISSTCEEWIAVISI